MFVCKFERISLQGLFVFVLHPFLFNIRRIFLPCPAVKGCVCNVEWELNPGQQEVGPLTICRSEEGRVNDRKQVWTGVKQWPFPIQFSNKMLDSNNCLSSDLTASLSVCLSLKTSGRQRGTNIPHCQRERESDCQSEEQHSQLIKSIFQQFSNGNLNGLCLFIVAHVSSLSIKVLKLRSGRRKGEVGKVPG